MAEVEDESNAFNSGMMGHCMLIGALTIAWNEAHETVFKFFNYASGMPKPMAEAVFFSLRSDSGQRDITRAVCMHTDKLPDEWKKAALSALKELDVLAGKRNAAIHTIWDMDLMQQGTIAPSAQIDAKYHNKKLETDVEAQFSALIAEVMKARLRLYKSVRVWEILNSSDEKHESPNPQNEDNN